MTIGERIKSRRKELGLSVDDVAQMLSKNRATVYRYESDNIHQLPFSVLENLSHILNCSTNYLYSGCAEDNTQTVGEKIKENRCKRNMTMHQLAEMVGVSEGTISRWESGDIANMRRDKVVLLAKALHTTPSYLAGWESAEGISLTHQEEELIIKYRNNPQMQGAVNKLLGI